METKLCYTLLALVLSVAAVSHALLEEGGLEFHEEQSIPKGGLMDELREELDFEDPGDSNVNEHPLALKLQNLFQKSRRYRPFLYQPQRFGREARGGLQPRFWSMVTPQRFGRK